jgi:hypothetical protein
MAAGRQRPHRGRLRREQCQSLFAQDDEQALSHLEGELMNWLQLFTAALSGGSIVKVFDFLYSEFSRQRENKDTAQKVVARHIDPILKSADQLLGHLISLSEKDLKPMYDKKENNRIELFYTLYLFAHFWACLLILQKDSIHVNLTNRKEGRYLLKFISTLTAKRNRLLTRAEQQVIGESLLIDNGEGLTIKSFFNFLQNYTEENSAIKVWFDPLLILLTSTENKSIRQKVLLYGVILHALVDNLDSKHSFIRDRKSYPNKLSQKTRNDIKNRIFSVYLPEVENHEKYWQT